MTPSNQVAPPSDADAPNQVHLSMNQVDLTDRRLANRHEIALLVGGRCRACAEPLRGASALRGDDCPLCHTPTRLDDLDRNVLLDHLLRRGNVRVGLLVTAVALSHLLIGWFPVASTIVVGLSAAWIRWQIVRPTARLLSPSRRRLSIWTGRLGTATFVAFTLVLNEALTLIPIAGPLAKIITSGLQVAIVAWLNTAYVHWQVRREEANQPIAAWEWAILAGTATLLIASTVALTVALVAAVTALDALAGYLLS